MNQVKEFTEEQHAEHVERQTKEARCLGCITCRCGDEVGLVVAYRCLYCDAWFCEPCAEDHFGMTVDEYHKQDESKGEDDEQKY